MRRSWEGAERGRDEQQASGSFRKPLSGAVTCRSALTLFTVMIITVFLRCPARHLLEQISEIGGRLKTDPFGNFIDPYRRILKQFNRPAYAYFLDILRDRL